MNRTKPLVGRWMPDTLAPSEAFAMLHGRCATLFDEDRLHHAPEGAYTGAEGGEPARRVGADPEAHGPDGRPPSAIVEERMFDVPATRHPWSADGYRRRWRGLEGEDIRRTPRALYDVLDAEFGFTIDVAALPDNALCERFWTPEDDGLTQPWAGERCWMNPPYSDIEPWVRKAAEEADALWADRALVVGLLPVRTDLAWFHDYVIGAEAEVRFIRGRLRFGHSGSSPKSNAPFPSMVVVWGTP